MKRFATFCLSLALVPFAALPASAEKLSRTSYLILPTIPVQSPGRFEECREQRTTDYFDCEITTRYSNGYEYTTETTRDPNGMTMHLVEYAETHNICTSQSPPCPTPARYHSPSVRP